MSGLDAGRPVRIARVARMGLARRVQYPLPCHTRAHHPAGAAPGGCVKWWLPGGVAIIGDGGWQWVQYG